MLLLGNSPLFPKLFRCRSIHRISSFWYYFFHQTIQGEILEERERDEERRGGNGRYNLRPLPRLTYGQIALGKRCNFGATNGRRTKMPRQEMYSDLWSDMPVDLYHEITRRLCLPDFLNSSRVCKNWFSFSVVTRKKYLKSVPPLAVSVKVLGKKAMSFHNIITDEIYKKKVMNYVKKFYRGVSEGFLIMENFNGIWFTNPFTSEELEFPKPAGAPFGLSDRILLTKPLPSSNYVVLLLHKDSYTIRASHLGSGNWVAYSYLDLDFDILDLVPCGRCILGLTSNGKSGWVHLSTTLCFRYLTLKLKWFSYNAKLVVSLDRQIMAVDVIGGKYQISRLNFSQREWTAVRCIGNQSLFVDNWNSYVFCDPRGWGGLTNTIYSLEPAKCSVFSVSNGAKIHEYSIRKSTIETDKVSSMSRLWGWYFPHLIFKVACVPDDEQKPTPSNPQPPRITG